MKSKPQWRKEKPVVVRGHVCALLTVNPIGGAFIIHTLNHPGLHHPSLCLMDFLFNPLTGHFTFILILLYLILSKEDRMMVLKFKSEKSPLPLKTTGLPFSLKVKAKI